MTRVVMGLLFDESGKILIAKRNKAKRYGGLWEFPGGKIEPGESEIAALSREIREELDAPVWIDRVLPGYIFRFGGLQAEFIPISGCIYPSDIRLLEHDEFLFIELPDIDIFPVSPYDHRAIDMLKSDRALPPVFHPPDKTC